MGLSAWRLAFSLRRCGNGYLRNGQNKPILRTHPLRETGSDYIGLVQVTGVDQGLRFACPCWLDETRSRRYSLKSSHRDDFLTLIPSQVQLLPVTKNGSQPKGCLSFLVQVIRTENFLAPLVVFLEFPMGIPLI